MHNNSFFKFLLFVASVFFFVSCDKEYSAVGDALIGENNFELTSSLHSVVAYNKKITAIQSNNLPVNALGIYDNPAFGKTTASFVTQLSLATINPSIGINPVIESVYLDVPYLINASKTAVKEGGGFTYELESIYGDPNSKIKLKIYESNRYLGVQEIVPVTSQMFYTNQSSEFDGFITGNHLNDDTDKSQNDEFFFNPGQNSVTTRDAANVPTTTYSAPGMRLKLNNLFFENKILKAPAESLSNPREFEKHFKGLYFKVEQSGSNKGSLAMINFAKGTITVKYKAETSATDKTILDKSIILNLSGATASLFEQSNTNTDYNNATSNPNEVLGDPKLYVKGGAGSVAVINLFGLVDNYQYKLLKNASEKPIDENGNVIPLDSDGNPKSGYFLTYTKNISPNGIPDELDDIRFPLIDSAPEQIYHSIKKRRLINDANLVFTIDATAMKDSYEPERLYLYDFTNSASILDYVLDAATNAKTTSKFRYGGFIKRDASTEKRGVSYSFNITNHIRNLVQNGGTNFQLGLAVTEDINISDFNIFKINSALKAPKASVMNPLGTILYGSNASDESKRLRLKIYYTKPK